MKIVVGLVIVLVLLISALSIQGFDAKNPKSLMLRTHCQTSGWSLGTANCSSASRMARRASNASPRAFCSAAPAKFKSTATGSGFERESLWASFSPIGTHRPLCAICCLGAVSTPLTNG